VEEYLIKGLKHSVEVKVDLNIIMTLDANFLCCKKRIALKLVHQGVPKK
jgi:hypothetical protein